MDEPPFGCLSHNLDGLTVARQHHHVMRVGAQHGQRLGSAIDKLEILMDDSFRVNRVITPVDKHLGIRQMPNQILAVREIAQHVAVQVMLAHERDGAESRVAAKDQAARK